MKKNFILLASLAVLFAACSDKGGDKKPADPTLEVTPAALQFSAEGETLTIKITTNQDWTVVENLDWIELSAGEGEACENLTVEVTAEANQTTEARNGSFTIKAGTLTKNVTLSQDFIPAPPPVVDNSTYAVTTGNPLKYADDLQDGGLYVIESDYYMGSFWAEADGKLIMNEQSLSGDFTAASVFEYKEDSSKLDTSFDDYGNWSAGTWKSLSTGLYIDADLNLNAQLASALYLEYANNWGGYEEAKELNVFDVYQLPIGEKPNTLWYSDGAFVWGGMDLYYEGGNGTPKRKYVVYEVAKNVQ